MPELEDAIEALVSLYDSTLITREVVEALLATHEGDVGDVLRDVLILVHIEDEEYEASTPASSVPPDSEVRGLSVFTFRSPIFIGVLASCYFSFM